MAWHPPTWSASWRSPRGCLLRRSHSASSAGDGGQDPAGWRVDDADEKQAVAKQAWALLQRLRRTPGTDDDGTVQTEPLLEWCDEVRRLCAEHGRAGEGDFFLGQLISHAWPCQAVCEVMERIGSPNASRGFQNGIYNARGGHWRGMEEGGDQEREIAASWRSRAEKLAFDYPFFSGVLEVIATQYEQEATENDLEVQARKRIGY